MSKVVNNSQYRTERKLLLKALMRYTASMTVENKLAAVCKEGRGQSRIKPTTSVPTSTTAIKT